MKEIVADAGLVAYCGLYCGACGRYLRERCPGCQGNDKAGWCKVRTCNREAGYTSCAECKDFSDPKDCRKFNNVVSKIIGFVLRSDRAAGIARIKSMGIRSYAEDRANSQRQSIRR
jgi:hypothetical protein